MKRYIEDCLTEYKSIFSNAAEVLEHLFCTIGNGESLDCRGYLRGNYQCKEPYVFGEVVPLNDIYPFYPDTIPLLKYKGCRDVGFKEAVKYLMDCILITPDSVEDIKEWKENINVFQEVLDAPDITDDFTITDVDKFIQSLSGETTASRCKTNARESVTKRWYFDVQHSDCPVEVYLEVKSAWTDYGLGNDFYVIHQTLDEDLFKRYPKIYLWLLHKGVGLNEEVIIHWWW